MAAAGAAKSNEAQRQGSCGDRLSCFQIKIYICVFVLMFTNSFTITVTYPFLPFMVEFLITSVTPVTLGNYVGALPSSYNAGRFFGSYFWGSIADYKGRKTVVIINCILMILTSGPFGFSPLFAVAVVLRFLAGASNSLPIALKATISESSSNKGQALAMAVYATGWGLGLVLGPAVGGALVNPVKHFNLTAYLDRGANYTPTCSDGIYPCVVDILEMFPYCLPGVVNALLILAAMILAICLLPETLNMKKKQKRQEAALDSENSTSRHTTQDSSNGSPNRENKHTTCEEGSTLLRTPTRVLQSGDYGSINASHLEDGPQVGSKSSARICCTKVGGVIKKPLRNVWNFISDSVTRKALLIYCTFSFAFTGLDETFSLFCKTDPFLGGLGFQESQIGLSLAIVGVAIFPIIVWLFPVSERLIGVRKSFLFASICIMCGTVMLPSLNVVARQGNTYLLWSLLILILFVIKVSMAVSIACISLFINNSVYFHQLASVNGLALSLTCISRTVSPIMISSLWSASLSETFRNVGFPFDYHFIFIICGLVYFACVVVAALLPKSIDQQKLVQTSESLSVNKTE